MSYQSEMSPRSIEIGRVFSRVFKAIRDCPTPFLILAGGMITLPDVLVALLVKQTPNGAEIERYLDLAVNLTVGVIGRTALVYAALQVMRTGKVTPGDSLSAGVRLWGPALGIGLLTGLGAGLAALLLIVPGIFLAVAWSVATPIRVDGKPGVTAAITRSFEMTRGSRWAIFAVWLIFGIAAAVAFAVFSALSALVGASSNALFDIAVVPLMTGAYGAMTPLLAASIYEDLSLGRGGGSARTAAVFD